MTHLVAPRIHIPHLQSGPEGPLLLAYLNLISPKIPQSKPEQHVLTTLVHVHVHVYVDVLHLSPESDNNLHTQVRVNEVSDWVPAAPQPSVAGWAGGVEDAGLRVGPATGCEGKWSDQ